MTVAITKTTLTKMIKQLEEVLARWQTNAKADLWSELPANTDGLKRWTNSHPLNPTICRTTSGSGWIFSPELRSLGSCALYHSNARRYEVVPFFGTFNISPTWNTKQSNRYATIRRAISNAAKDATCELEGFQVTEIGNKDNVEHVHWMGWIDPLRIDDLKKALKKSKIFKAKSSQHRPVQIKTRYGGTRGTTWTKIVDLRLADYLTKQFPMEGCGHLQMTAEFRRIARDHHNALCDHQTNTGKSHAFCTRKSAVKGNHRRAGIPQLYTELSLTVKDRSTSPKLAVCENYPRGNCNFSTHPRFDIVSVDIWKKAGMHRVSVIPESV